MSYIFPVINLDEVQGILIDIDDTLYSYAPCHESAMRICYEKFQASEAFADLTFGQFGHAFLQGRAQVLERLSPQGTCRSRLLFFQDFFEDHGVASAHKHALIFEDLYWDTFISQMRIWPEAQALLHDAVEKKIPICALTDMQSRFQIRKLEHLGVLDLFDYVVTSEEVGEEKPSHKMFQRALQKLRITNPASAIMIGDNFEKDILGAKQLGITPHHIKILPP
ncbi:MAG: HAD family hydrolase [Spirochaetia bacterium]